jgi:hypothetical protein
MPVLAGMQDLGRARIRGLKRRIAGEEGKKLRGVEKPPAGVLSFLPPPLMQVTPSRRFALEQSPPLSCKETW